MRAVYLVRATELDEPFDRDSPPHSHSCVHFREGGTLLDLPEHAVEVIDCHDFISLLIFFL